MNEKKNTAAIGLLIAAVLFILTAFSSADAWEQTAGETVAQTLETMVETSEESFENTLEETLEETIAETLAEMTTEIEGLNVEESDAQEPADTSDAAVPVGEDGAADASNEAESASEEEPAGETAESETADGEMTEESAAEQAEESIAVEIDYFADQFIVTVTGKTALNVREEPSADSAWVGKMYEGSGGTILEVGDGWSKIKSGNVTGWVSNDYILTGEEGKAKALEVCELVFEVESDALKVRSAPTTEEENKLRAIYGGETYTVISVQADGWVQIQYAAEKTGWVAGEYGTIRYDYDTAMTRKEIQDAENAKKKVNVGTTSRESTSASTDEVYLLACLINCESNHYEGQLAVANVVLNRVKSSRFPNSISEVIYAAGQFGPVRSGKLAARLEKGPSATALQAAQDALNGVNNIGDFMYFRSAKSADLSKYSSYTIVAGNCFYKK